MVLVGLINQRYGKAWTYSNVSYPNRTVGLNNNTNAIDAGPCDPNFDNRILPAIQPGKINIAFLFCGTNGMFWEANRLETEKAAASSWCAKALASGIEHVIVFPPIQRGYCFYVQTLTRLIFMRGEQDAYAEHLANIPGVIFADVRQVHASFRHADQPWATQPISGQPAAGPLPYYRDTAHLTTEGSAAIAHWAAQTIFTGVEQPTASIQEISCTTSVEVFTGVSDGLGNIDQSVAVFTETSILSGKGALPPPLAGILGMIRGKDGNYFNFTTL